MVSNTSAEENSKNKKENIVISIDLSKKPIDQISHGTTVMVCEVFKYLEPNNVFITNCGLPTDLYLDIILGQKKMKEDKIIEFHFSDSIIDNYKSMVSKIQNKKLNLFINKGVLTGFSKDYLNTVSQEFS
jgi:hypothetical protein